MTGETPRLPPELAARLEEAETLLARLGLGTEFSL